MEENKVINKNKPDVVEREFENNKLLKYGITRKSIYAISSVLICIVLVIVLSLVQAGFDIRKLSQLVFWIEFAILAGLSIFGMMGGQRTSDDVQRNKPDGVFRKKLRKLNNLINGLTSTIFYAFFGDWLYQYRLKKLQKKKERFLMDLGVKQMEVLDLDFCDLDSLKAPFKKDWKGTIYEGKYKNDITYFLSCSDEQIEAIRFVLNGGIKVSNLPTDYFTTAVTINEDDMWESASKQDTKKAIFTAVNYSYRLVMLLVVCMVMTAITANIFEESTAETLLNLVKRVFCIMTAYFWGIFIGAEIVRIDTAYIEFKISILEQYKIECEQGLYVHKSLEDMAKEEYEKIIKIERGEENGEYQEIGTDGTQA